ncbi:MAG: winged helix-turn-helix domain-containing protein, partial [Candidatus Thermoplasmatota archaeon]|nr:winged helix-turn-helix domain-containing protein [Candidatus Thermoplasmatota archaeon]
MGKTSSIGNINEVIGASAGKVWHALSEGSKMSLRELLTKTKLKNNLLCSAIGWLARENKIYRDNELYALGDANLTPEIGTKAGKVWGALNEHGALSM